MTNDRGSAPTQADSPHEEGWRRAYERLDYLCTWWERGGQTIKDVGQADRDSKYPYITEGHALKGDLRCVLSLLLSRNAEVERQQQRIDQLEKGLRDLRAAVSLQRIPPFNKQRGFTSLYNIINALVPSQVAPADFVQREWVGVLEKHLSLARRALEGSEPNV